MMSYKELEQSLLLQEVSRELVTLEDAIANINSTRNQLKDRSLEVKCEIQTTVTRQLEALREREVYLLHQVDLIHQAKDAALQGHEDQLHQALGSLTTTIQLAESGPRQSGLTDALEKLKNLNMNPHETPNLSFKANLAETSEAIRNFGQIDSRGLPFDGLFHQDTSSTCLPRPFEDYEDDEHHVLYKSLSNTGNNADQKEISVSIPRMSHRPEDWLFMPTDNLVPVKPTTSPGNFQFPPFLCNELEQFLSKHDGLSRSVSSTASIKQWLCDIQVQGDVEEEETDFEVISPPASFVPASTKGSSIEVLSMDEPTSSFSLGDLAMNLPPLMTGSMPPPTTPGHSVLESVTLPYFQQAMSHPASHWLLNTKMENTQESSPAYCREILSYFHEVSSDTKQWLQQYSDKKQKEVYNDACAGASNCCTTRPQSLDIENLAEMTCIQDPTSDTRRWLFSRKDEDVDMDEAEIQQEVRTVCKANEPCLSFGECVSDENCCSMLDEGCSGTTSCCTGIERGVVQGNVEGGEIGAYFDAVVKQGSDNWLLCGDDDSGDNDDDDDEDFDDGEVTVTDSASETVVNNVKPNVPSSQAFSSFPQSTHNSIFPPFSNPMEAQTTWLLCEPQPELRIDPSVNAYFTHIPNTADVKWLIPAPASNACTPTMEDRWSSMFSHKLHGSPTRKPAERFYNNFPTTNKQPLTEWLSQSKSYIPNIPNIKSDWLITKSEETKPFSKHTTKEVWLARSSSGFLYGQGNYKELQNMENKNLELPECCDEKNVDVNGSGDLLFECFKRNELGNTNWLCDDNLLVD